MVDMLRDLLVRIVVWTSLALATVLLAGGAVRGAELPRHFASPDEAMEAFGTAVSSGNEPALQAMLGSRFRRMIPPIEAEDRVRFLAAWVEAHKVELVNDKLARIAVGTDGWTLPIPLVKAAQGWQFDTVAGAEEMRIRRIGRNELAVMQTLLAVYDAQRDYASADRDNDGLRHYASRLRSSPGKHDGLYWPTAPGEPESPIGPVLAGAGAKATSPDGYYGYHYKLLTRQGPKAMGGAYNYLVGGKLVGGFAVLAWPVRYGDSGVMSFMINHNGVVYERNLGKDSAKKAAAIKSFDPGEGWREVTP